MVRSLQLVLSPQQAFDADRLRSHLAGLLSVDEKELNGWKIRKRSIDARSRSVKVNLSLDVFVNEPVPAPAYHWEPRDVRNKPAVIVIGAGPAGLFAALRLIE